MYKILTLTFLIFPIFGCAKNGTRINELKEAEYKKTVELYELSLRIKKVASQYYDHSDYDDFLDTAVRKTGKTEEELKKINIQLEEYLTNCLLNKKDTSIDLSKELFYKDFAFDAFKGLFVESAIEMSLLIILTERLNTCFKELIEIKKELNISQRDLI